MQAFKSFISFLSGLNIFEVLNVVGIGVGFLLALFAFYLLHNEQRKDKPSEKILRSIAGFQKFCLVVIIFGSSVHLLNSYIHRDVQRTEIPMEHETSLGIKELYKSMQKELSLPNTEGIHYTMENNTLVGNFKLDIERDECREILALTLPGNNLNIVTQPLVAAHSLQLKIDKSDMKYFNLCANGSSLIDINFFVNSNRGNFHYKIGEFKASEPVFDPPPGQYGDNVEVSISSEIPNSRIYYKLNAAPTEQEYMLYSQPILIEQDSHINAYVKVHGLASSSIKDAVYNLQ